MKVQPTTIFGLQNKVVKPWGRALIRLDLHKVIPKGYYGQIVEPGFQLTFKMFHHFPMYI